MPFLVSLLEFQSVFPSCQPKLSHVRDMNIHRGRTPLLKYPTALHVLQQFTDSSLFSLVPFETAVKELEALAGVTPATSSIASVDALMISGIRSNVWAISGSGNRERDGGVLAGLFLSGLEITVSPL